MASNDMCSTTKLQSFPVTAEAIKRMEKKKTTTRYGAKRISMPSFQVFLHPDFSLTHEMFVGPDPEPVMRQMFCVQEKPFEVARAGFA